jgi:hypothetical protein
MPESPGLDRFGRFINRRELAALSDTLDQGERVLYALEAYHTRKGLLAATDRRLVFLRAGLLGRRLHSWPHSHIRSVHVRLDVDDAVVTVATAKGNLVFAKCRKRAAEAFGTAVKNRPPLPHEVVVFQDEKTRPRTPKEQRLERLDRMLGQGSITRAEYDRAKQAALDADEP